jgi:altronate dehydratase large subunit
MTGFLGYERADGKVGIRNHVAVISSVACANGVVEHICTAVPGAVRIIQTNGCGRGGDDLLLHSRTLQNLVKNPNFANVLVIGLGCETIPVISLQAAREWAGLPVETLEISKDGGTEKTTKKGIEIVRRLIKDASCITPKLFPYEKLSIGTQCGGSDAFSGVTANPAIGVASDWIVDEGGTTMLTEVTEMKGTNHILKERAVNEQVAEQIEAMIGETNRESDEILGVFSKMSISPGNMDGGMSTGVEKSLGCIAKGGTRAITQVVEYAEVPAEKGFVLMDGPGYDPEGLTGLAASGCQVMLFSTGRGSPVGFPGVPVIKVSTNSRLYNVLGDNIDVNAGKIMSDGQSIDEVGQEIIDLVKRVADGEQTKAEIFKQDGVLCMYTKGRSF